MATNKYRCAVKGCKLEPSVKYLGDWLCDKHWDRKCEKKEKKEQESKREALAFPRCNIIG